MTEKGRIATGNRRRNALILVLCAPLLLAGCVTYVRPGATPAMRDSDLGQCQSLAYRRAPPELQTEMVSPAYVTPPAEWCRRHHHHELCRYEPGYYVPPEYANVDVNDAARNARIDACMSGRGYVKKVTF